MTWDYRPTIVVDFDQVSAESVQHLTPRAVYAHAEWIDLNTESSEDAAHIAITDAVDALRKHNVPVSGAYIVAVEFKNDYPTGYATDIRVEISV